MAHSWPVGSRAESCVDDVESAVVKARLVPDRFRVFDVPAKNVRLLHGIDAELLERLVSGGMPCRSGASAGVSIDGESYFDTLDLWNVGHDLRLPGPRWNAMRWFRSAFEKLDDSPTGRTLHLVGKCPEPGHSGECRFELDPALAEHAAVTRVQVGKPGEFTVHLMLPGSGEDLSSVLGGVLARSAELRFHYLPGELARDLEFAAATGLADCRLASLVLAEAGTAAGVETRMVSGLILSLPFPARHSWIEVRVDRRWAAADPFYLTNLIRWGFVGADTWSPARSPAGLLLGLHAGDPEPLMRHNGSGVHALASYGKRTNKVH